jgi:hypothetical protein
MFYPVIGDGVRVPLLVISPFAKRGHIAHGQYDSCSITRFIEDNWGLGRLDEGTADTTRDSQVVALNGFCDIFCFPPPTGNCGVQCGNGCGDIDGSGEAVDLVDFATFATCFALDCPTLDCDATEFACSDLDASSTVDLNDFATFAALFGQTPTLPPPFCLE